MDAFLSRKRKVLFLNVQNLYSAPSYFYNLFSTENTLRKELTLYIKGFVLSSESQFWLAKKLHLFDCC